jgi:hypothetical protein
MTSGLEVWLREATRHLAKDSTAQVRAEIQEHYEAAREAAMLNGATSDEAMSLALNALGSARAANRQYRRVLLTSGEAKMLREGNWEARFFCVRPWLKWLIATALLFSGIFAVATAIALLFSGQQEARDMLLAALGLSPLLAAPLLPIYTPWRSRIFRCVKWGAMTGVLVLILGPETLKWSWLLLSCLWPLAWNEWTRASVRRKLPISAWPKHLYL